MCFCFLCETVKLEFGNHIPSGLCDDDVTSSVTARHFSLGKEKKGLCKILRNSQHPVCVKLPTTRRLWVSAESLFQLKALLIVDFRQAGAYTQSDIGGIVCTLFYSERSHRSLKWSGGRDRKSRFFAVFLTQRQRVHACACCYNVKFVSSVSGNHVPKLFRSARLCGSPAPGVLGGRQLQTDTHYHSTWMPSAHVPPPLDAWRPRADRAAVGAARGALHHGARPTGRALQHLHPPARPALFSGGRPSLRRSAQC